MVIFNSKPSVDSLQKESTEILSVFKQTVQKLGDVNKKASEERQAKIIEAEKLQEEAKQLETLCNDNANVIANINNLLNI